MKPVALGAKWLPHFSELKLGACRSYRERALANPVPSNNHARLIAVLQKPQRTGREKIYQPPHEGK